MSAAGPCACAEEESGLCLTAERLRQAVAHDFTPAQRAQADEARAWLDAHTEPRGGGAP